jgi:hypothetical protein
VSILIGKINNMMRNIVVFSLVVLIASASAVTAAEVEFLPYGSEGYKFSSILPGMPIPPTSILTDPAYNDSMMNSGQAPFGWGECGSMNFSTQGPLWYPMYFRKWVNLSAGTSNVRITLVGPGLDVPESVYADPGIRELYVNGILMTNGTIGYEYLGNCTNILKHTIDVPNEDIYEGANLITIWIQAWNQPWRFDMRVAGKVSETPTIGNLMGTVAVLDLPEGIKSSLISKLEAALTSIEDGKTKTAVNHLNAFKNRVEAQSGKKISEEDAETLLASADAIITAM